MYKKIDRKSLERGKCSCDIRITQHALDLVVAVGLDLVVLEVFQPFLV